VLMAVFGWLSLSALCLLALPDVRRTAFATVHSHWGRRRAL